MAVSFQPVSGLWLLGPDRVYASHDRSPPRCGTGSLLSGLPKFLRLASKVGATPWKRNSFRFLTENRL